MSARLDRPERSFRKRLRAEGYDYSTPGMYMVTICVHHMERRFGAVQAGEVVLNEAGFIVERHWCDIPRRYPGVELDAFVIMPNHLHGIIALGVVGNDESAHETLSTVVGTFKSLVMAEYSRGVHAKRFPQFNRSLWLRSFSDRIIRSDRMLETERTYIEGNPGRWQQKFGDGD